MACRNLLVTALQSTAENVKIKETNFVVKIADFGMSRVLENHYYNVQSNAIPLRWSAPEVMQKRQFSSQSDVWSFGVVIWEIFSFGKKPYPEMGNTEAAEKVVLEDYRMPNPDQKICSKEIYQIMLDCWEKEANQRPNFQEIYQRFN